MLRALLLSLVLTGCGVDTAENTDTADENDTFTPTAGQWVNTDEVSSGTCDFSDGSEDTGTVDDDFFDIEDNGDGTFRLFDEGVGDDFDTDLTCTRTDMAFVCDEFSAPPQVMDGSDASLNLTMNVTGTFTDAENFTATAEIDMSCVGADCDMLSDYGFELPCSQTIEITAASNP